MSEENKERIKEYQKNIAELIKADSLNLTKMHNYIDNELFILLIFVYKSMHCFSSTIYLRRCFYSL